MIETIKSIKNRIAWIEEQAGDVTGKERENITHRLKEIDADLKRFILLHVAINKQ